MQNIPAIKPAMATPKTVDNRGNTITWVAIMSASLNMIKDLAVFLQYVLDPQRYNICISVACDDLQKIH